MCSNTIFSVHITKQPHRNTANSLLRLQSLRSIVFLCPTTTMLYYNINCLFLSAQEKRLHHTVYTINYVVFVFKSKANMQPNVHINSSLMRLTTILDAQSTELWPRKL